MADESLRPFLARSAAGHVALVLAALWLASKGAPIRSSEVYRIDFIGAAPGIINREKESDPAARPTAPAPPQAGKPPPQTDADAFPVRRFRRELPRPSLLSQATPAPQPRAPVAAQAPAAPAAPAPPDPAAGTGGTGQGSAQVEADMPDFPYPWYLSQLRTTLWDRWSKKMPEEAGECTVVFSVLRDGRVTDLRIESTSGGSGFDYQALSAVQDSTPFPPLPPGFRAPFLKVHVQFKS